MIFWETKTYIGNKQTKKYICVCVYIYILSTYEKNSEGLNTRKW